MVNYFYSLVFNSLEKFLTEKRFNKVKKGIMNAIVYEKLYISQWFERVSIDYIKMNKKQREKEFMHIMDRIYNYMEYEDYYNMKKSLEKFCTDNDCTLDDVHYEDYPEGIEW